MKTYRFTLTIKIPAESDLYAVEPDLVLKAIRDDLYEPGLPETIELNLESVMTEKNLETEVKS